jgi:nucleoside transporter
MKTITRIQLSLMMFLEFFVWGAWYVTMSTYLSKSLNATGQQNGDAYSAMAIATIVSPIFIGMIADRFFAAQKLLGILHLAGAAILYYITTVKDPDIFYWFILLYSLTYAPTLALVNSIAFNQIAEPQKTFAGIRVFGTLGWIATGWLLDKVFNIAPDQLAFSFKLAAAGAAVLGILSFFLPNTPPRAVVGQVRLANTLGKDALVLLRNRSFLIFFIASILICIPLSFYYSQTNQFLVEVGMKNATSNMTYGQVSEALCILLIPFFFRRLGVKWMIAVGMIAWVLRFLCFGFGNAEAGLWMLFAGIILHGVCFDFFFVTGQIYTDTKAGERIKSSAQALITMATYGIGMFIGTRLSGFVADHYTNADKSHQWQQLWMVPAFIAGAVLILFLLFFNDRIEPQTDKSINNLIPES